MLSNAEALRYARQTALAEIGVPGQEKIKSASVLVIGAGGLGSPLLMYLAAAGVGRIGIVEFDTVSESNLQRQILYSSRNVGESKLAIAAEHLRELNPFCIVEPWEKRLDNANANDLVSQYGIIADCADNFETKLLAADAAHSEGKIFVYAGINGFDAQLMTVLPHGSPCLRCIVPAVPPRETVRGPFGATAGIAGAYQACEIIKIASGLPPSLAGRLMYMDTLNARTRIIEVKPRASCTCRS